MQRWQLCILLVTACHGLACQAVRGAESSDITACKEALKVSSSRTYGLLESAEKKRLDAGICDKELEWVQEQIFFITQSDPVRSQAGIPGVERLLRTRTQLYGETDHRTLTALALLIRPLSNSPATFKRAEDLAQQYVQAVKRQSPTNPQDELDTHQVLGGILAYKNEWEKAIAEYELSLSHWETIRPEGKGWAANSMNGICEAASRLNRYDLAVRYGKMAVETFENAGLGQQLTCQRARLNLGLALTALDKTEEALPLYVEAYNFFVAMRDQIPVHLTVDAYNATSKLAAYASNVERRYDKASDYLKNLEFYAVKGKGETSEEAIRAAADLARTSASCGRNQDAVSAYERVLARRRKAFGDSSPIVRQTQESLDALRAQVR